MSNMSDTESPQKKPKTEPASKGRLQGDACNGCRSRKVRCPGERPSCSNCTKRARECVYSDKRYMLSVVDPSPSLTESSPLSEFLSVLGGSAGSGLTGQTLPPEYADLDLDQLLRDLDRDIAAAAAAGPKTHEPPELTPLEQEHLLWLYFNHQVGYCLEMHFATFWARLHASEDQPHPALLNAMYLVTCGSSPSHLRNREEHFYQRASAALQDAVVKNDRLLDAARAGFLLSCYLYGRARFNEAVATAAITCSLATSCGLCAIPQSRHVPPTARQGLLRAPTRYIPPPKSQIELADRIYTFWSIFLLDRCATIAQDWTSGLGLDICTPLPRPWADYEHPGPDLDQNVTLFDVLEGRGKSASTNLAQMIKGLEIMYRCSQLGLTLPKVCPAAARFDAVWGSGPQAQRERESLERALKAYTEHLPASLTGVERTAAGNRITNTTATLQFMIGASQMFLHDSDTLGDRNTLALEAARRMLGVIHLLGDQGHTFDSGLLMIMIWAKIGKLLIREMLRLEDAGDAFGAAKVDAELDVVIRALQTRGKVIRLSKLQAQNLEGYRRDPARHTAACRSDEV